MQLHGLDSNELQISLDLPILDTNIFCFIYGAICLENIHMAKVVRADEMNLKLGVMRKDWPVCDIFHETNLGKVLMEIET